MTRRLGSGTRPPVRGWRRSRRAVLCARPGSIPAVASSSRRPWIASSSSTPRPERSFAISGRATTRDMTWRCIPRSIADGTRIATVRDTNVVQIWEVASGTLVAEVKTAIPIADRVEFSPDGNRVVAAGNGVALVDLRDRSAHTLDDSLVTTSIAFSPDGAWLVAGAYDHTARIWNVALGREHLRLQGHADVVDGVTFDLDSARVVTTSRDRTVRIWKVRLRRAADDPRRSPRGPSRWPGSTQAASASSPRARMARRGCGRAASGIELASFAGHAEQVAAARFVGDDVVTAGADGTVRRWSTSGGVRRVRVAPRHARRARAPPRRPADRDGRRSRCCPSVERGWLEARCRAPRRHRRQPARAHAPRVRRYRARSRGLLLRLVDGLARRLGVSQHARLGHAAGVRVPPARHTRHRAQFRCRDDLGLRVRQSDRDSGEWIRRKIHLCLAGSAAPRHRVRRRHGARVEQFRRWRWPVSVPATGRSTKQSPHRGIAPSPSTGPVARGCGTRMGACCMPTPRTHGQVWRAVVSDDGRSLATVGFDGIVHVSSLEAPFEEISSLARSHELDQRCDVFRSRLHRRRRRHGEGLASDRRQAARVVSIASRRRVVAQSPIESTSYPRAVTAP